MVRRRAHRARAGPRSSASPAAAPRPPRRAAPRRAPPARLTQVSILRIGAQVELLLEHGAPISPKDSNGFEPVQYAAYTGGLDILKKLLSVGAVTRPPGSQSCVDLARGQGHAEVVAWLEQHEAGDWPPRKGKKGRKGRKGKKARGKAGG